MYNVTDLFNTTDYGTYLQILDRESGYMFGITIMVMIAVIFTLTFWKEGVSTSLAASGFITTLAAIIMFGLGMLAPEYIFYPVIMFAGAFIAKKLGGGS